MRGLLLVLAILVFSENVHSHRSYAPGDLSGSCKLPPRKFTDQELSNIKTEFITQYVDHNDLSHGKTFEQRYFADEQYANANKSVAFLFVEGETEAGEELLMTGELVESAKKFNATLFLLEHRFYGQSIPDNDLSTENLKYLTIEQVLADIANFIEGMKIQYKLSSDVKWVVFGCSYSGALVAWFRQKYPDLTKGGVASSAPILAKVDFADYYKVVYEDFRSYRNGDKTGKECTEAIQKAFEQFDNHLQNKDGQLILDQMFDLCGSVTEVYNSSADVARLTDQLILHFKG
nr:unnamed protein product [Callosobruchus chinensis]